MVLLVVLLVILLVILLAVVLRLSIVCVHRRAELAPIERIWRQIKYILRSYCHYTLDSLKNVLDQALRSITQDQIRQVRVVLICGECSNARTRAVQHRRCKKRCLL